MGAKRIGLGIVVVGAAAAVGIYFWMRPSGPPVNQPTWEHTYGGSGRDAATSAAMAEDGGTVIAGDRTPEGRNDADAWVIHLDKDGNTVWERTWGSAGDEHVEDIQPTQDGGYIVTGDTEGSISGSGTVWVAKLDGKGSTVWEQDYEKSRRGTPSAIIATADGGYVVAGRVQSKNPDYFDGWVAKLDGEGKVVWERFYGGQDDENIAAISETPDGGYIFAGATQSKGAGKSDAWVVKINSSGEVRWEHTYGSPNDDAATDLIALGDQGYAIAGWTDGDLERHKRDGWIIRLDAKGNKLWEHAYGGRQNDVTRAIRPANSGGFIVVGTTVAQEEGSTDAWVFRVDKDGHELWHRSIGGNENDGASAVVPQLDGAFIVVGETRSKGAGESDAWVLRLNALGEMTKAG